MIIKVKTNDDEDDSNYGDTENSNDKEHETYEDVNNYHHKYFEVIKYIKIHMIVEMIYTTKTMLTYILMISIEF